MRLVLPESYSFLYSVKTKGKGTTDYISQKILLIKNCKKKNAVQCTK